MKKADFNDKFRTYVREQLSPRDEERTFVSNIYGSIQDVLGKNNCLQIGSYPRYTAIRPLHDLDVLYILGDWDPDQHEPGEALAALERRFRRTYENPTRYQVSFSRQTHSLSLRYQENGEEIFAVDVVPAYIRGQNAFGDDTYVVPEIARKARPDRRRIAEEVASGLRDMEWIPTDPRGYITAASDLNQRNPDFRKAAKLSKAWKGRCKDAEEDFPLKSFHLEQIITRKMEDQPGLEIFDIIFQTFCDLPQHMRTPQIPDRADPEKMIDAYVEELSANELRLVDEARDGFLVKLEDFEEGDSVDELLEPHFFRRSGPAEEYLFDQKIPMLTEETLHIFGRVAGKDGGFRSYFLTPDGRTEPRRSIYFSEGAQAPEADVYKWKVKNDDSSPQPRGEITDHQTANYPEQTAFKGHHVVEGFAIREGRCIARGRQDVRLASGR